MNKFFYPYKIVHKNTKYNQLWKYNAKYFVV